MVIAHSTATSPECIKKTGLNPGRGLRPKKGVYPSIIKNNPKGKVVLFYNTNTKKHYKYGK